MFVLPLLLVGVLSLLRLWVSGLLSRFEQICVKMGRTSSTSHAGGWAKSVYVECVPIRARGAYGVHGREPE